MDHPTITRIRSLSKILVNSIYAHGSSTPTTTTTTPTTTSLKKAASFILDKTPSSSPRTMEKRKTLTSHHILEATLTRESSFRRNLESFADSRFESENVRFLREVIEFKKHANFDIAQAISHTYIEEGSCMQVNISHQAREQTLKYVEDKTVPAVKVFALAEHEVSSMMVIGGVFHAFVWTGKLDGFEC